MQSFASDNFSGVHPEVFEAMKKANHDHAMAYGGDTWTERAEQVFKKVFGSSAEAFIVHNGTGANVCALKHILHSWQGVLCQDSAHIWTDECGAASCLTGSTLLPMKTHHGKLDLRGQLNYMHYKGNEHHVQPHAISITQSTELGTVYSIAEMQKIAQYAKEHKLIFHVDGARIANAAASLNVSLKELTTDIGVDVLSFGGTKNGLMGADAVVFLNPELAEDFKFVRKQYLQLPSKMRYLSAQMIALLDGDLWLRNAKHSNEMAKLLESKLKDLPQVPILYPVQANSLFVQLPIPAMEMLQKKFFFWIWNREESIARLMTTWDTQPEWIDQLIDEIKIAII